MRVAGAHHLRPRSPARRRPSCDCEVRRRVHDRGKRPRTFTTPRIRQRHGPSALGAGWAHERQTLQGKVALVTGGSRGLGREMVLGFAEAGASVVIASRKLDACQALAEEVASRFGSAALPVAANVSSWDDCDALVAAAYDRFDRVDVLVNNAGMSPLYPSLDRRSAKRSTTRCSE